jgi:hypothetical protein
VVGGQIVSKGLQAEALTIEDRDDLFHQHRSNRSAAGNIPQLIRAPSLTACIGHFHAINSLHQWCMLHQVDLTVSTGKSLTRVDLALPENTELVDTDVPVGRLVRIVCDQRKACFEVHLILAINLQTAQSPPRLRLRRGQPAAE